ncbi:hypothetical protein ODU07_06650 [Streptococcus suis]|uniref:DUF7657 domain-containing protein n=1 Tax=Streptococcus sp. ZY1909104 TaxID=3233335 RepID=UPI0014326295|nr:hypothetical protein [Streptococcus suis]
MKKFFDLIIGYRYFIGIFFLIFGLVFELHGSSIGNWNNYGVSETIWGTKSTTKNDLSEGESGIKAITNTANNWISIPPKPDGTIIGTPRMIRTDEWLVQTPFYLSQSQVGNQLVNPNYLESGQNMLISYNAPIFHISALGKPFNWGFLFLDSSKGLSWYWCFKIIGLILLSFEISMILTRKNKLISSIGSLWITFTPAVQWWFMQHLGDILFNSLLLIVSIYHFFNSSKMVNKVLHALLISIGMIGFVFVIYPAFQVPFAYVVLLFFVVELTKSIKEKRFQKRDVFIISITVLLTSLIIFYCLIESIDAIRLTLNTVYPGSRVSTGGEISISQISEFLYNFIIPFKIPSFSNQVELSSAIHFAPILLVLIPFYIKKENYRDNLFELGLVAYFIFLIFYSIVGIPTTLAKITLFSFVTSSRAWQALSILGVMISVWIIGAIWNQSKNFLDRKKFFVYSVLLILFLVQVSLLNQDYISLSISFILVLFYFCVAVLIINRSRLGLGLLTLVICLTGMTVNPVVHGLGVLENKSLSVKIKEIVSKDSEGTWITDSNNLYQFPQIFGAKTIGGVRFYPDINLMRKIDSENKFENYWNRYAHIHFILIEDETYMENPAPDNLKIHLNVDEIKNLDVKYVLTNRDLEAQFGNQFRKIYGPDLDGNIIFKMYGT